MNIVKKSYEHGNIVFVLRSNERVSADPSAVFALLPADAVKGATFVDDPTMELRIFHLPAISLKIICEQHRFRLEDQSGKEPSVENRYFAENVHHIAQTLLAQHHVESWGMNFDLMYRFDNVIPQQDIMRNFLAPIDLEDVRDFGWQYSIVKNKGLESHTYYFKALPPLEMGLHVNVHFVHQGLPTPEVIAKGFLQYYQGCDKVFDHLSF